MNKNELLATFMGGHKYDDGTWRLPNVSEHKKSSDLIYDRSWDLIMPVWIKFRDLEFTEGSETYNVHGDWVFSLQYYLITSDEPKRFADRLFYAIKWYDNIRTGR